MEIRVAYMLEFKIVGDGWDKAEQAGAQCLRPVGIIFALPECDLVSILPSICIVQAKIQL